MEINLLLLLNAPAFMSAIHTIYTLFDTSSSLDSSNAMKVNEAIPDIFEKINDLRDDILIYFKPAAETSSAFRTHFGPAPFIVINQELAEQLEVEDPDALHWIYKHEISHIYFNDQFKAGLLHILAYSVSTYVLYRLLPLVSERILVPCICGIYLAAFMIGFAVSRIALCFFERRADDFAIAHSTDEELLGGRRFFQACDEAIKEFPQKLRAIIPGIRIKITSFDGSWWDTHPSDSERAKKIENEMRRKGMDIEAIDVDPQYLEVQKVSKRWYFNKMIELCKPHLCTKDLDVLKVDCLA